MAQLFFVSVANGLALHYVVYTFVHVWFVSAHMTSHLEVRLVNFMPINSVTEAICSVYCYTEASLNAQSSAYPIVV